MSKDFITIERNVVSNMSALHKEVPDTINAFSSLASASIKTNELDTKTKELMALAIGITVRCDGCVAYHAKQAHQHGATRAEVAETIALAIYMGGGPSAVYGGDALAAYDQFAAE